MQLAATAAPITKGPRRVATHSFECHAEIDEQSDARGLAEASIAKRWGGGLREIFTDADAFLNDYLAGHGSESERRVIFSAAISIDFSFFEDNQRR